MVSEAHAEVIVAVVTLVNGFGRLPDAVVMLAVIVCDFPIAVPVNVYWQVKIPSAEGLRSVQSVTDGVALVEIEIRIAVSNTENGETVAVSV